MVAIRLRDQIDLFWFCFTSKIKVPLPVMHKVIVQCRTCDICSAILKLMNRATGYWVYHNASLLCPRPEQGAQVPEQVELICSRGYLLLNRDQPQVTLLFSHNLRLPIPFCRFMPWDNYQMSALHMLFFVSRADIRWGRASVTPREWDLKKIRVQFCPKGCSARCSLCTMLLPVLGFDFQVLWLSPCHSEKAFRT